MTNWGTTFSLIVFPTACTVISNADETSTVESQETGSGSGSGSGSAAELGPAPPVEGADTDNQTIFEFAGWPDSAAPGDYLRGLRTAAQLTAACVNVESGTSNPIRVGGHQNEVLTLLGCNPASASINAGVLACFRRIGGSSPTVILDGCNLANEPSAACARALAAQGVTVVAANDLVQTRMPAYSRIYPDGEWITFPASTPSNATINCTCSVVSTRSCTGAINVGYSFFSNSDATSTSFAVTSTSTCGAMNAMPATGVTAYSYYGSTNIGTCDLVYGNCR